MILEESSKPNFDKRKICKDFGISKSMIYKILAINEQKNVANFKKFGRSKNDELELKLCEWIKSKNENGMVLSGDDKITCLLV